MSLEETSWNVDVSLKHATIRWRLKTDILFDFEIYNVFADSTDGTRLYFNKDGSGVPVEKFEEAEVWCTGTLRFDGCINYDHPCLSDPEGPCLLHECGRGAFRERAEAFERLYDLAREAMSEEWSHYLR